MTSHMASVCKLLHFAVAQFSVMLHGDRSVDHTVGAFSLGHVMQDVLSFVCRTVLDL